VFPRNQLSENSIEKKIEKNRRNSDIFLEKFLFQVNSLDILFHSRRIVLGINLGKIPRIFLYQGVFPKKFLVQTELFAKKKKNASKSFNIFFLIFQVFKNPQLRDFDAIFLVESEINCCRKLRNF
jgi:hypothetical protein